MIDLQTLLVANVFLPEWDPFPSIQNVTEKVSVRLADID